MQGVPSEFGFKIAHGERIKGLACRNTGYSHVMIPLYLSSFYLAMYLSFLDNSLLANATIPPNNVPCILIKGRCLALRL